MNITDNTFLLQNLWKQCTLYDVSIGENAIVDGPFGSNLKTSDYINDPLNGTPVLTTKNLDGDYSDNNVRFISKSKFEELKRSQVNPGDIIVAKIGSIGKTGIYPSNARTAIIPANLLKFSVSPSVNFRYVYAYLNYSGFQKRIKEISTSTAQPAFNVTKFRRLEIPLPPLAEQHRIVAKIEELFSELDRGVESLKTVQAQLKTYRQAVLKHAFDQITDMEPLDKLTEEPLIGLVRSNAELVSEKNGYPYIKMNNIDLNGNIDTEDVVFVSLTEIDVEKYKLQDGDILINTRNSYELVGKAGIVRKTNRNIVFNNNLLRLRAKKRINPLFIGYQLIGPNIRMQMRKGKKATTNICALYQRDIYSLQLKITDFDHQNRIVAEIESRLSVCDSLERTIEQSLKQSEALRQSILKKAFEGKLVPQDPNDEPASVLLDRIRAERELPPAPSLEKRGSKKARSGKK